jgi:N-acetylglutamate synthase-like GNAT family acetyltransferase
VPNRSQVIEIAKRNDAVQITAVINSAFRIAEGFFVEKDRISTDEVMELFNAGNFLLVRDDGLLKGCVYIEPRGDRAYLGLLSVDPSCQQTGLGSQLMTAAEDHCRELGCQFMDILIVNVREELPAFYQRRGYVETGTSPFPAEVETKVPCHFINMSKPL